MLFLLLYTASFAASSQDQPEALKSQPATKLESFSSRTGIVLIKGFSTVGVVNGLGRISIDAREFRDASNPKQAQYGVAIEVKESGRLERESTSFIDEDEIESLIKGLEYISKIDRSVTALNSFEAQYRTKGDFAMTVFSGRGGEISLGVSSGRIGRASAFLKLSDAQQIRNLLLEAKKSIAVAKAALKQ
jgi:hypothetical protein